jgi:tetratricopeptide (TPR) repeat protein
MERSQQQIRGVRADFVVAALLVLLVLTAYHGAVRCDFVNFDDDVYVTENAWVRAGLTWPGLRWAFRSVESNWHPLTWLSHMIDVELYGLRSGGHHYTSVLWHIANTILLHLTLVQLTGCRGRSAVCAAWFAVHPVHVEPVTWISARKDLLSTFFWLTAILAHAARARRLSPWRSGVVLAAMCLGLMCKGTLVTLPFVLLLLDYWPLGRFGETRSSSGFDMRPSQTLRRLIVEKVPLLVIAICGAAISVVAQQRMGAIASLDALPLTDRLANGVISYALYLKNALWPATLTILYPHPGREWSPLLLVSAVLFLVIVSAGAITQLGRRPYLAVGWFWYLGTLVPVLGIVQIGQQALADRYSYFPLIGIYVAAVWGAHEGLKHFALPNWVGAAVASVLVAAALPVTRAQVSRWTDSVSLFRHAVAVTDRNLVAHTNLGVALAEAGHAEAAFREYERALELRPADGRIRRYYGFALERFGRLDEAAAQLEKAIEQGPRDAMARFGLAKVRVRQGRAEEAITLLRQAVAQRPAETRYRVRLAMLLLESGAEAEALEQAAVAAESSPLDAEAQNVLGIALVRNGQLENAVARFRRAVRLDPISPQWRRNLKVAERQLREH